MTPLSMTSALRNGRYSPASAWTACTPTSSRSRREYPRRWVRSSLISTFTPSSCLLVPHCTECQFTGFIGTSATEIKRQFRTGGPRPGQAVASGRIGRISQRQGDCHMIRVSVMYPRTEGDSFDMDYYVNKHMPMVRDRCGEALKG